MQATANETIECLADADGHVIEPGDLWVERLPRDLRPLGPHFYRDEQGVFHSKIYGIDIANLEVMHGGIRAKDMLENMGLACAMGVPLERVFASPEPERHTIVDAPPWAIDGRGRPYSDPVFDPLWPAIVDTGMKLGLHPLPMWDQDGTSRGYRLPDIMAASCLGFPLDMIYTLYDMMAGGVFDRFPTMPTMILEAGAGWLPSMFERFEEHQKRFGALKVPEWKTPPMEIFLRQMMIVVEACEEVDLKIALDFLPADRVALASDWPHYDGTRDLVGGFHKATAGLDPAKVQMVASGTFERWFGARA